jgi:hypothetical protein
VYKRELKAFLKVENERFFKNKGCHIIIGRNSNYLRIILNFGLYKTVRLRNTGRRRRR